MDDFNYLTAFWIFVLGSILGSFFNVLIYRIPQGLSIFKPRSFCTSCKTPIPWWANIPVISYLFLKGRCFKCRSTIPFRYFLVELLTPSLYLFVYFNQGITRLPQFGIEILFLSLLLVITFIDLETYLIPDVLSLGGLVLGIALSPFNAKVTFMDALLGVAIGGGMLALIAYGYLKARKVEGMGGGDIKLLAMIGAFTGWEGAVITLFISALTGTIAGIILIAFRKWTSRAHTISKESLSSTMIPYGPFLALGGFVACYWGNLLWNRFLGL